MLKKIIIGLVALILVAVGLGAVFGSPANATEGEPCVPSDAWTETIEHPAVTHEETVHHEAVTHEETVIDQEAVPAVWANFQPNNVHAPFIGPALYPTDPRGSWNVHNQIPGGHEGPDGVYFKGNPLKGGNWFYRQAAVEEISHVIVVVDQEAYDEVITVVDEEAWTEVIEHPAVECPDPETPEQPDPLVQEASSATYNCGDDFQTEVHSTTTTEYVWDEETQEWVLGEPVTVTDDPVKVPVDVVPCPEEPEQPETPENPEPEVKHTVRTVQVPLVIDAGL